MFSKIKLILGAMVLALLPVSAAQASSIIPNEKHYYTVQLRSDERALNYANIIFENKQSTQETKEYRFRLPSGVTAQSLTAKQVLAKKDSNAPKPCLVYETLEDWQLRANYNVSNGSQAYRDNMMQSAYESGKLCLERSQEDSTEYDEDYDFDNKVSSSRYYYDYYYYSKPSSEFHYSDLEISENNGEYIVNLSNTIKPGKQGSVLISYIADGVVSGGFGVYNYDYRTLVSKDMISSVTAAINFDEGLYSRDVKQKREVESRSSSDQVGIASGVEVGAAPSRSTDNTLFSVGQGGVYTKTQTNLLPGDVMSVKGTYSERPVGLFVKEIFIALLAIAAVVVWAVAWRRHYLAKRPARRAEDESAGSDVDEAKPSPRGEEAKLASDVKSDRVGSLLSTGHLVAVSGISMAIAVGISILWLGLVGIVTYQAYGIGSSIFMYVAVISWVVLVLLAVFALPLAYVLKFGARTVSKWIFVHFIVFGAINLVLVLLLFTISLASGSSDPSPYY